jgi:hypothetical protein
MSNQDGMLLLLKLRQKSARHHNSECEGAAAEVDTGQGVGGAAATVTSYGGV